MIQDVLQIQYEGYLSCSHVKHDYSSINEGHFASSSGTLETTVSSFVKLFALSFEKLGMINNRTSHSIEYYFSQSGILFHDSQALLAFQFHLSDKAWLRFALTASATSLPC